MESEQAVAAAQEALDEHHQALVGIHREVQRATPWWLPLSTGLLGPAQVAWLHPAGVSRVLVIVPFVLVLVVALAIYNVRIRKRVQPRVMTQQDMSWRQIKENVALQRRHRPDYMKRLILGGVLAAAAFIAIAVMVETGLTLWFVLPASFCLMASMGIRQHNEAFEAGETQLAAQAPQ